MGAKDAGKAAREATTLKGTNNRDMQDVLRAAGCLVPSDMQPSRRCFGDSGVAAREPGFGKSSKPCRQLSRTCGQGVPTSSRQTDYGFVLTCRATGKSTVLGGLASKHTTNTIDYIQRSMDR
ncbi:hypothetical protein CIB48_g11668 [Xylaria polymorpha]|nr:hypothetical protein CIB48_g11668 [Xylaria polymorpha]